MSSQPNDIALLAAQVARGDTSRPDLIDVREDDEWAAGHIPGARHIPLGELQARASEVPRDRPVVLYCRAGVRSAHGVAALRALGYQGVHNLEGGFLAWQAEGGAQTQPG